MQNMEVTLEVEFDHGLSADDMKRIILDRLNTGEGWWVEVKDDRTC